jgi:hypothetical protein
VRPDSIMARSTLRPIRPKPLIATFTDIASLLFWHPKGGAENPLPKTGFRSKGQSPKTNC